MNYIFFHTVTYNEKLLIAWVNFHYPHLKLSFSAPGWVTFKSDIHIPLNFTCPLALRYGVGLDIISMKGQSIDFLLKKIDLLVYDRKCEHIHYFERAEIQGENLDMLERLKKIAPHINEKLHVGKACLQIFKINEGQYATGLTTQQTDCSQSPFVGALKTHILPQESPSRAYLKMAQIHDHFMIDWKKGDIVLELGASPGGISTYLLEQGLLVHALDSAPLKITHPNLKTIVDSVQRLKIEEIAEDTKWIVSDLNLSPKQVIHEIIRLGQQLPKLQGIFITLKLTHIDLVARIEQYVSLVEKSFPYFHIKLCQVPSHKQETHLVAMKRKQR